MNVPEGWALVPIDMTPDMIRAYMRALNYSRKEIEGTVLHLGPDQGPHEAGFVTGFRAACQAAPAPP